MIVDLAPVVTSLCDTALGTAALVIAAVVRRYVHSKFFADLLDGVLEDAVGRIQQASDADIAQAQVLHPNLPGLVGVGVRFVVDHAPDAVARLGLTPAAIADKIIAKIGTKAVATNLAIAGNDTPASPHPLAPLGPIYAAGSLSTAQLNTAELARHEEAPGA